VNLPGIAQDRENEATYYVAATVVGAVTGVLGSMLHLGVDRLLAWPEALRHRLEPGLAADIMATGVIAAAMVVISVWLVRTFAPEASGSGVQEIEGAMAGLRTVRWRRVLPVKFCGGFLSLGAGLVIGREGPTIHIGAAVSQAFSDWLKLPVRDGHGLLAAGGAAGLAAAFSAPLASILFVTEETRREFPYSFKTYTGLILASVTSGIVTEAIAGRRPFMALIAPQVPLVWLPVFVVLGILLGGLGVLFNRTLIGALDLTLAIGRRSSFYIVPVVVGFTVGALMILRPEATTGGEMLAVRLIGENLPLSVMALIVLVRFVMSMASYATGVPGGIFAPILSLATAFGLLFAMLIALMLPLPAGMDAAIAVAAMGGLFAATVRAPLVGIVLVAELTGAYSSFIPVILTAVFANLCAEWLGGRPIYEVLLARTLALAGTKQTADGAATVDQSAQIGGWDRR